MKEHCDYEIKQIKEKLVGGKIIAAISSSDGQSFGLHVKLKDREHVVWVDCDPEGNGPGHLAIEGAVT